MESEQRPPEQTSENSKQTGGKSSEKKLFFPNVETLIFVIVIMLQIITLILMTVAPGIIIDKAKEYVNAEVMDCPQASYAVQTIGEICTAESPINISSKTATTTLYKDGSGKCVIEVVPKGVK